MKKILYLFMFVILFFVYSDVSAVTSTGFGKKSCVYDMGNNTNAVIYLEKPGFFSIIVDEYKNDSFMNEYAVRYDNMYYGKEISVNEFITNRNERNEAYFLFSIIDYENEKCLDNLYYIKHSENKYEFLINSPGSEDEDFSEFTQLKNGEYLSLFNYNIDAYSNDLIDERYEQLDDENEMVCSYNYTLKVENSEYSCSLDLDFYFHKNGLSSYNITTMASQTMGPCFVPENATLYNFNMDEIGSFNNGCLSNENKPEIEIFINERSSYMMIADINKLDEWEYNYLYENNVNTIKEYSEGGINTGDGTNEEVDDDSNYKPGTEEYDYTFPPLLGIGDREDCAGLLGKTDNPSDTAYWLQMILNVMKYLAIAALVALSILDFIKAIASQDGDALSKSIKTAGLRLIYTVLLFVFPIILEFVFEIVGIYTDPFCELNV